MLNDLFLAHPQRLRHPIEEGQIRLEIEVDEFAHNVPGSPCVLPPPTDIPLWEVDPVIDGLNPQQSKRQQEGKRTEYVYEGRDSNIFKSSHENPKRSRQQMRERESWVLREKRVKKAGGSGGDWEGNESVENKGRVSGVGRTWFVFYIE